MKYNVLLFIGFLVMSCTQYTTPSTPQEGSASKFQMQDSVLHLAGLPVSSIEKQNWVEKKTYHDTDRLIQAFLSTHATKLSEQQLENFNRATSYLMLHDMQLIETSDHTNINKYLTAYLKSGGNDASLIWKGIQIAKKNSYWDSDTEAEANWFINRLIDARVSDFSRDIKNNEAIMSQKPVFKAFLTADNDKMLELTKEYKAISLQVINLPQRQPTSKQTFMQPTN